MNLPRSCSRARPDLPRAAAANVPVERPFRASTGKAVSAVKASVRIGDVIAEGPVEPGTKKVAFRIALLIGKAQMTAPFTARDGNAVSLYCSYMKKM